VERDMRRTLILVLTCITLSGVGAALARPYPTRPVTLIVPYGAGGPLDTLTRIVSERMRIALGQSLVIENVSGASGTIGVGRAVRAAPDGYTVSVGNWPTHVVNGAMFALPYDLLRDFEPVALLSSNPYVVVARKGLPAKNLQDLIAFLKANPEHVTLGTGTGLRAACQWHLLPEGNRGYLSVCSVSRWLLGYHERVGGGTH
jgi:tripartite-type tricarboxylate transporter receptor subunit TctC